MARTSDSPSRAPASPRKAAAARPRGPSRTQTHEIRIIGGLWKRTRLKVLDKPGLRPTPDRVRETLFNWLGQDLSGWRCLDAFAGTGALGLEAASRGAKDVLLVEQDGGLLAQLHKLKEQLKADTVRLQRGDGVAALAQAPSQSLDLVLLDPPFDSDLFEPALKAAARSLKPSGFLYLESPVAWDDARLEPLQWKVWRYLKAGAVHAHLLQPAAA